MGKVSTTVGRVLAMTGIVLLAFALGIVPGMESRQAAAQDYESMMPKSLEREAHKLDQLYLEAINEVNAAQSERLARQAAGAADEELKALDQKIKLLVSNAEKIKVEADYVLELYKSKAREYMGK